MKQPVLLAVGLTICTVALAVGAWWDTWDPASSGLRIQGIVAGAPVGEGAISAVSINSDGWTADVTIDGFTTNATYDFGTLPSSPNMTFTVTSEGYTSGGVLSTVSRTVYGTIEVRKPYPNNADTDETVVATTNMTVRVALSEFIYDDDTTGAGKSGTAPTVTIAAGWATDTGDASNTSQAVTSGAVVNNSTLAYPQVIGQWDNYAGVTTADRVQTNFITAATCRHRLGIKMVEFDATGQTSTSNVNTEVTAEEKTQRTASTLYATAYHATNSITPFTQGELIDLRFRAYPVIGDADSVLDTDLFTNVVEEVMGRNKATIICDKSDALDTFAIVATNGNDGTGVSSTTIGTAEANPFLTIDGAHGATPTPNRIQLQPGTFTLGNNNTRIATNGWIVVEPHSSATISNAIGQVNGAASGGRRDYNTERFKLDGITVQLHPTDAANTMYLDGEHAGNFLYFEDCLFDANGTNASVGIGYQSHAAYYINATGDLGDTDWNLGSFSGVRVATRFDGCILSPGAIDNWYGAKACSGTGAVGFGMKTAANIAPLQDNQIFEFNRILSHNTATKVVHIGGISTNNTDIGTSLCGNLIERVSPGGESVFNVSADGITNDVNHTVCWHNTAAGERFNWQYNDSGTLPSLQINTSWKYNSTYRVATKHDLFDTPPAGPPDEPSGLRVGGWAVLYGVGWSYWSTENELFPQDYMGIDYTLNTPADYVDDQSAIGGDTGGGDYTPAVAGNLLSRVPAGGRVLICDLFGTDIPDDGTGDIGAVQRP